MKQKIDKLIEVANHIEQAVGAAVKHWRELPDPTLRFRPAEVAWSIKEIVGHMIDSASNNHQRFVRLQLTENLTFPDYGQDNIHWVSIQNYQDRTWLELLVLWQYFNMQLAYIIRSVESSCLSHIWQVDPQTSVTLFDLMTDYHRHLKLHLDQIEDTLNAFDGP